MKKNFIVLSLILFSSYPIFSQNTPLYKQLTEEGFNIQNNDSITSFVKQLNDPFAKIVKRKNNNLNSIIKELTDGTIYIRIPIFNDTNVNDIRHYFRRKRLYRHYIIDLRNNSGGDIKNAANFSDLFLKKNSLIFQIKKYTKSISFRAKHNPVYFENITILIDKHTASVAEAVAGTLQHHIHATVLGENSHGKVAVQKQFIINDHNALYLTVGYMIPPSGQDFHSSGITPNIYIKQDYINFKNIKEDLAVKTALKLANKARNR